MTNETFEQLARAYGDAVFRVACHALRNRADAEDVTQTALLKLYQSTGEFESSEHARNWLLRVAVNESRRLLMSPWRRHTTPLEDWDGPMEDGEEARELMACVMALERKYRLPIYLHYYEGLSVKEIALVLSSNPSTIQTRLQRGREKLRLALTDQEEGRPCVQENLS